VARLSKKNEELLKAVQKQAAREQDTSVELAPNGAPKDAPTGNDSQEPARPTSDSMVGVGVDLVEIERMERAIQRTPRIVQRVFSSGEREYAWSKAKPAVHYAAFFAAREAVFKALGCGFAGLTCRDVEVVHDDSGKPSVLLHGNAAALAEQQGIVDIQISLSHTHHMAVASAVALRAQSSPRKNLVLSPMEELARQFKELRSMLDDLGVGAIIDSENEAEDGEYEDSSAHGDGSRELFPITHENRPRELSPRELNPEQEHEDD